MSKTQSILLIDDSKLIHKLVRKYLADLDVTLHVATTGMQGIANINKRRPDLILLDVTMKGLSGFEVCQRLKADPATHDIPIIFLTRLDDVAEKVKGFELGAMDYVTKPFEKLELRARVRSALQIQSLLGMLTKEARRDGLTGLHNRRYFDDRLEQEIHRAQRNKSCCGLLLLDVDYFKQVNDEFGHPDGDDVIKRVGVLLGEVSRRSDVACRFGGDEFALILPDVGGRQSLKAAMRLWKEVREDDLIKDRLGRGVTVSVGVAAMLPGEQMKVEDLLKRADEALYTSKRNGKDRVTLSAFNAEHDYAVAG
ncbi:diguanylate cyclase [Poriferisphaera sp. WC338]|uniref:diguanylate cyclase n=1 Tax=Poriferisphaera sp. WC338 TaxID=3425129 RepID=UPI003D81BC6C